MDQKIERKASSAVALVAGFVLTLLVIGVAVSLLLRLGLIGIVLAILVAAGLTAAAYFLGDALALRLTGAAPADPQEHARLDNLIEGLCGMVGVSRPRVFVIDDSAANAFVCGRDQRRAAVVVTSGLLERASRIELEGVLARELSQIKSGEATFNTMLTGLVGIPAAASDRALRYWWGTADTDVEKGADGANPAPPRSLPKTAGRSLLSGVCIVFVPLAPLAAKLVHAFVPRDHDGFADLTGVAVTRYPPGLAGALDQMRLAGTVVPSAGRVTAHLWVAEPLPPPPSAGFAGRTLAKFSTHLPLEERVDALRER